MTLPKETSVEPSAFIRSMHPYAFRSGEWGQIVGHEHVNGRLCLLVIFPDGATDSWVVDDPAAEYEFATEAD